MDPDLPTLTELALAVTLLAQDLARLRHDLSQLNDVLSLDTQVIGEALMRIEAAQAKGLGGSVLGYRVRLVP